MTTTVRTLARKIAPSQPMGCTVATIEVPIFGIPEQIKVYNARDRSVQELGKAFRSLECAMSVAVSSYLYTMIQEVLNLSDLLKKNGLYRFNVKKEMNRAFEWIDNWFAFNRRNQGDRNTAWETVMSEMNGKVYEDLKILRLLNRRYALNNPHRIKVDADVVAQLLMVQELVLLCRTKFDVEVKTFQENNKVAFEPRAYGRHFDCAPLTKCFDNILMLTTGAQTVLDDPDVTTQMKVIIRKFDNADNLEECAGIAVEENEGGVFNDILNEQQHG